MAIQLVSHIGAGISQAGGTTGAINTTGANLLVLFAGSFQTSGPSFTVSDNKNNVWTLLSGNNFGGVFYSLSPTVGSGHTFTVGSSGYPAIVVQAFSGVRGIDTGIFGTAASAQAPSVTPSGSGALLVTFTENDDPNNPTASIDTGFTITDNVKYTAAVNYGGAGGYLVQSLPAAVSPTWTMSPSGGTNVRTFIQAFKAGLPATAGVVGLGTWQGSSFASVFSSSANPINLDLMQVVNEGGQVVWNLNSAGVTATNPANPTNEVLLAKYFGSSLSAVFQNPLNYDLLQIKGAGGAVVFHIDYLGNVNIP